jgi:hypothetical protein
MKKICIMLILLISLTSWIQSQNITQGRVLVDTALIREWYRTIVDYQLCQAVNDTLIVYSEKQGIEIMGQNAEIENFNGVLLLYQERIQVEYGKDLIQQTEIADLRASGDELRRKNKFLIKSTLVVSIIALLGVIF